MSDETMRFRKRKLIGGRLIKTGIAVFGAATICNILGLPVVFASIIAIVTIEPTVSDSIKKGVIRFPAALIGAGLAMTFLYIFGHNAITYALAAVVTIFICNKLKLESGTLIATITALAMIPGTESQYLLTFVERAGTTLIGLVVSTFVNFIILPARYVKEIKMKNNQLFLGTANLIDQINDDLRTEKKSSITSRKMHRQITTELGNTFQLCRNQRKEWKYRHHTIAEVRMFFNESKRLEKLQEIHYHLANLLSLKYEEEWVSEAVNDVLYETIEAIALFLRTPDFSISTDYVERIDKVKELFIESKKQYDEHVTMSVETIILFVILSIYAILLELEKIKK